MNARGKKGCMWVIYLYLVLFCFKIQFYFLFKKWMGYLRQGFDWLLSKTFAAKKHHKKTPLSSADKLTFPVNLPREGGWSIPWPSFSYPHRPIHFSPSQLLCICLWKLSAVHQMLRKVNDVWKVVRFFMYFRFLMETCWGGHILDTSPPIFLNTGFRKPGTWRTFLCLLITQLAISPLDVKR